MCIRHGLPLAPEAEGEGGMVMKIKSSHNNKSLLLLIYSHSYLGLTVILTTTL